MPAGSEFEPPATVIEDFRRSYAGDDDDGGEEAGDLTSELAISTVDLQRYLSDGGAMPVLPEDDVDTEADHVERTREARRAAAGAMRDVLTGSVSDLSGSVKRVAGVGGVVRSVLTPMRRVQRSMQGASAMYQALMGIAERRKGDSGDK